MAKKGSRKRMAAAGGGLLGLGVLVAWLLNMLPNFEGPGTGQSGENVENVAVSVDSTGSNGQVGTSPADKTESPDDGQLEVVDVLIDDYDYYLRSPENPQQLTPVELERVIELAKQAQGNEDGIRVRIARRKDARFTTQETLRQRLAEAGLGPDAVFLLTDYVEE